MRLSHEYECFNWLDRLLITGTLPQDYTRHSIDNNFDVLPLIGAKQKLANHVMELFLSPSEERWATIFCSTTFGKKRDSRYPSCLGGNEETSR